jgi:hypothetical protein
MSETKEWGAGDLTTAGMIIEIVDGKALCESLDPENTEAYWVPLDVLSPLPETYAVSAEVRWMEYEAYVDKYTRKTVKILQQKWLGCYGSEKWEEVPTVKE